MNLFKRRKKIVPQNTLPFCSAVVPAAGSSERMGGCDKLFELIDGVPVLALTLMALDSCKAISEIIIVTRESAILPVGDICRGYNISKAVKVIRGGKTRMDSVFLGLMEISPKADLVAIHDGARPLVTAELIYNAVNKAAQSGAAAPALQVVDTIKTVSGGQITATPDRSTLYAVQTPQVFNASLIKAAISDAKRNGLVLTDDCSAVERIGANVSITEGSPENIKITRPSDLVVAAAILRTRRGDLEL